MPATAEQLEAAITALQAQRAVLGDAVADLAIAPLRTQLEQLRAAQAATPVQHLQLVSVLFLDVVGSTALADRLDPEDIQHLMDGLLGVLSAVVDQHGGRVLQYAGDSLLAAFGVDEVHEDDAERAVSCGLALLRAARTRAAGTGPGAFAAASAPGALDVRVGIDSGNVLIGGGVDGDNSIRGITVNIAARMEQTAPVGAMRISQNTWRLVRGLFDMQEQPPLLVKGRDEPMTTYLVQAAVAEPAVGARRGVEGVTVPMLGRDAELAQLQAVYQALCGGGARRLTVTIVADAGIGKTRLTDEFAAWVKGQPQRARTIVARALERGRGRPYGLLRALLLNRLGLAEGRVDASAWLAAAKPQLRDRAGAAVLGHLLGIDCSAEPEVEALRADPLALRDRAFFQALQCLDEAAAPRQPLLIVLDDLHWADEGSLDFVEFLQRRASDWPLLLLLATRPELFERRAAWAQSDDRHPRIELRSLDASTSAPLMQALLRRLPEVPEQLLSQLALSAEGNPFFIEELVNMLIDRGVIDLRQGTFVPQRLMASELPATLVGVLQARLATLPPHRRRTLQMASVAGAVF
jgi:class 3 adenylate cyclase